MSKDDDRYYRDSKQLDGEKLITSGAFARVLTGAFEGDKRGDELIHNMMQTLSQNAKDNVALMRKTLGDDQTLRAIAFYGDEEITRKAISSFNDEPRSGNSSQDYVNWKKVEEAARKSGNKALAEYALPTSHTAKALITSGRFIDTLHDTLNKKDMSELRGEKYDDSEQIRAMMSVLSKNPEESVRLMRETIKDGWTLIAIAAYGDEKITAKSIESFTKQPHDGNFHTNHIYWPQIEKLAKESGNKPLANYVADFSRSMSAKIDRERSSSKAS